MFAVVFALASAVVTMGMHLPGVLLQEVGRQQQIRAQESRRVSNYRRAVDQSGESVDRYNLGTALLADGRHGDARQMLRQSLTGGTPDVVERAYYNFGISAALDGRVSLVEPPDRRAALEEARDALRELLRRQPGDDDARWNLEVVESWLVTEPGSGEQQRGGRSNSPRGGDGESSAGGTGEMPMMSPEQAARLLDRAGDAETAVRERLSGRDRADQSGVEKNW